MSALSAQYPWGNQTYSHPSRGGRGGSMPKLGLGVPKHKLAVSLVGDFGRAGDEYFEPSGTIVPDGQMKQNESCDD